jgi:cytochrome c peroxidase
MSGTSAWRIAAAAFAAFASIAPLTQPLAASLDEPIKPIPLAAQTDARKVALGRDLFFDQRLSKGNTISCATCHRFDAGGAFPAPLTKGADGKMHVVNAPTVFNAAFNFK